MAATVSGTIEVRVPTGIVVAEVRVFDDEISDHDPIVVAGDPAQLRPYPSRELGEPKRFGDIVDRAAVETDDHIDLRSTGGQHDDGQRGLPDEKLAAHVDTVAVRQTKIEEDEIGTAVTSEQRRLGTRTSPRDFDPFRSQRALQVGADAFVVLDDQDAS